jgi:hypothetical protein
MPVKNGQNYCSIDGPVDSKSWTCRLSGMESLLFNEAVESEEKHRRLLAVSFFCLQHFIKKKLTSKNLESCTK